MTQQNRETLLTLAWRCEKAMGGDRELDLDCWWWAKANGSSSKQSMPDDYRRSNLKMDDAPRYSSSLDAAMSLVDPRALWAVGSMEEGPFARLCWPMPDGGFTGGYVEAHAATPALALCAASLRARATLEPTGEKA